MFENLSSHLADKVQTWRNTLRFNDKVIEENLHEIKKTLIQADVALKVVDHFIATVKKHAPDRLADSPVAPGQAFLSLVHETLLELLGESSPGINLKTQPPALVLMTGLSGGGKTSSAVKLARWLKKERKKMVAVTSCDTFRPAAQEQIEVLAAQANIACYPCLSEKEPAKAAVQAQARAVQELMDVLIVDTGGCQHTQDNEVIGHVQAIQEAVKPIEVLLVLDCMTGQSAIEAIEFFAQKLALSGLILSKTDADARGGVALSARYLTRQPIKFIGTGEHVEDFDEFEPRSLARRILGLGDMESLIKKTGGRTDAKGQKRIRDQLSGKKRFTLNDMRREINKMKKVGNLKDMLAAVPGVPQSMLKTGQLQHAEQMFSKTTVIIDSMTPGERDNPEIIKASHKRRIATGSGCEVQDVNQILTQFAQMQKVIKKAGGKRRKGLGRLVR